MFLFKNKVYVQLIDTLIISASLTYSFICPSPILMQHFPCYQSSGYKYCFESVYDIDSKSMIDMFNTDGIIYVDQLTYNILYNSSMRRIHQQYSSLLDLNELINCVKAHMLFDVASSTYVSEFIQMEGIRFELHELPIEIALSLVYHGKLKPTNMFKDKINTLWSKWANGRIERAYSMIKEELIKDVGNTELDFSMLLTALREVEDISNHPLFENTPLGKDLQLIQQKRNGALSFPDMINFIMTNRCKLISERAKLNKWMFYFITKHPTSLQVVRGLLYID